MTSTQPIRGSTQAAPVAAAGPITCVEGNQLTAQNALSTLRLGVKERFFPCVFGIMSPETQEKMRNSGANLFDPAVQNALMDEITGFLARVTDTVTVEKPGEVHFKMTPETTTEFAKFIQVDGKWYMD